MLQAFVPNVSSVFFRRMLQVCLSGCCICFTHMLQVFYLNVAYVCNGFHEFSSVLQVFQTHDASVSDVSYVCCNSVECPCISLLPKQPTDEEEE